MKRGQGGYCALVAVDKPLGMTSHDVVNRVRRITGERRVGHAGTLDPAASGVLVIGIGAATRLTHFLTGHDKRYRARIAFGTETDTYDAEGRVVETAPTPPDIADAGFAARVVSDLVGVHKQVPPAFSAKRTQGKHAYERARTGEDVMLEPVEIRIGDAGFVSIETAETAAGMPDGTTIWNVEMKVSSGTYIRSIAHDLGHSLGTVAHLAGLRRIESGRISIDDAVTLEELEERGVTRCQLDPARSLGFPIATICPGMVPALEQGKAIGLDDCPGLDRHVIEGQPCSIVCGDRLRGVHVLTSGVLKPRTVIPGGVTGVR